jgi:F-type H+-transporting ATPase subunit delta
MHQASRRRIAQVIVDQLQAGKPPKAAMQQLAAYLYEHGQLKNASYVLDAIQVLLAESGVVNATVLSARELSAALRSGVEQYVKRQTKAREVHIKEVIDESLIGGVIIRTPLAELDASVATRLKQFQNQGA